MSESESVSVFVCARVCNSFVLFVSLQFALINEYSIIIIVFAWMIIVYRQIFAFVCLHCPSLLRSLTRWLCVWLCVYVYLLFHITGSALFLSLVSFMKRSSVCQNFSATGSEVQIFISKLLSNKFRPVYHQKTKENISNEMIDFHYIFQLENQQSVQTLNYFSCTFFVLISVISKA